MARIKDTDSFVRQHRYLKPIPVKNSPVLANADVSPVIATFLAKSKTEPDPISKCLPALSAQTCQQTNINIRKLSHCI